MGDCDSQGGKNQVNKGFLFDRKRYQPKKKRLEDGSVKMMLHKKKSKNDGITHSSLILNISNAEFFDAKDLSKTMAKLPEEMAYGSKVLTVADANIYSS